MKKTYCIVCDKYEKSKNPKYRTFSKKTIVPPIISSK